MKKALAVVSFGTTYPEARAAIEAVEQALAARFPEYTPFRAFTSGMVIRRIEQNEGVHVEAPDALFTRLAREGYEEVLCQSLHVINGDEFTRLEETLKRHMGAFSSVRLGVPLLTESADYTACAEALMKNLPHPTQSEALVLMGHGTGHFANAAYCQLENTLRHMGYENVYVATVEGFPELDYVLGRLARKHIERVYAAPLMVVAGDHAQNDLAGEEPDSWRGILEAKGYKTEFVLRGIGEFPEIAELFCAHCAAAKVVSQ